MYFMALALDYDGTLASNGKVSEKTVDALIKVKASGRKLIMVTGRQLDDLKNIFEELNLFDLVVAENGALIYSPQAETQHLLAKPPPLEFIETLQEKGIKPLMCGKVIVATLQPEESKVLDVIRKMGLGLEIIFNKTAVMVLPSGINKQTGLEAALKELDLSMNNIIGMGDAENDHPFLRKVGLGIAVANAYESVKESAGFVTKEACGLGVEELIYELLKNEDALVALTRNQIIFGEEGQEPTLKINPADRVLIAGSSGIGKSTLATFLTEKMVESALQFCIFDPEGDYEKLENAIGVGEVKTPPSLEQVIELLEDPNLNVVVNTLGIELKERPSFFAQLAPKLLSLKAKTGRPHYLIIDEAHHLLPAAHENISVSLPKKGIILITVHPEEIAADALKLVNIIIALGPKAQEILEKVSESIQEPLPNNSTSLLKEDELLVWQRTPSSRILTIKAIKPKQQHKRHTRKYAIGDLSEEFSFYFKGPKDALNLRAQNLMIFLQIAEGIDDETWIYHLKRNDYSDWFKNHIKDDKLADAAREIESNQILSASQSRQAIANLVKELYTAPASVKD